MAAIDDYASNDELPEHYRVALAWADIMLAGGAAPDAELEAALRHHFDDAQLVELTYAIGAFIGYSKQLIVLGLEPVDMPVTVIPAPA